MGFKCYTLDTINLNIMCLIFSIIIVCSEGSAMEAQNIVLRCEGSLVDYNLIVVYTHLEDIETGRTDPIFYPLL